MKTIFVGAMVLPVLWYIYRRDGKAGRRPPDRSTGTEVRVFVVAAVLFFLYYMAVSFGASVTMALWALTAFFFIVSFTLFLVYSNKIKKVTSTD